MRFKTLLIKSLFLLVSCSNSNSWTLQSIPTGDLSFDSSRLRFISSQAHSPLLIEMMKFSDKIETFVSLNRFHFTKNPIPVKLQIDQECFEEATTVYEGAMRLRLSENMTQRMIQALQEGKEIAILIDGFDEKLKPDQMPGAFSQFIGNE